MKAIVFLVLLCSTASLHAQVRRPRPSTVNLPTETGSGGNNQNSIAKDTARDFVHRDDLKDSITISYRYLDSTRKISIDSSVNDFDNYYTVPSRYQNLGNNGAAAFSLIFQPNLTAGWDAGFHAFDIYSFTLQQTKIYRTTRPFSSLSYQIAAGKEQMIKAMHTQNPSPSGNFGFDYRLITAPGLFVTQNTNHNNYRFFGSFSGKRRRYNATAVIMGNVLRASENGGIVADSFLSDPNRKDRFSIPVNLGNAAQYRTNPFITTVLTGNVYRNFTVFLRQYYDLGKRDSIAINDSTTEYLFYPRFRFQHSFTSAKRSFQFRDVFADSALYQSWYNIKLPKKKDTVNIMEKWQEYTNDLTLVEFPDIKNQSQFFAAGVSLHNLRGDLKNGVYHFYNIVAHAEYRNRTKSRKWDIELNGEYYTKGLNEGDYLAHAKLSRFLNNTFGDIIVHFTNVNRTPSFVFDNRSSFNLDTTHSFKKENTLSFGITSANRYLTLGFRNTLMSNYTYFYTYYQSTQYSTVINILQFTGSTRIPVSKKINWYIDAAVQQTDGAGPVKIPLFYTRSRLAFEGRFYKNLNLSTGLEGRYYSPYKANNYSPLNGQFVPQDTVTISNRPDIAAFLNFRIKSFTAYFRAENLNTVNFSDGLGFTKNNFAAPLYPIPGLIIRLGIQWWFVN